MDQSWFEKIWLVRFDGIFSEICKKEFTLSPNVFDYVVDLARGKMERRDNNFCESIAVEKLGAVALRRLATDNSYRTISKLFGIGKSTIIKILKESIQKLVHLAPRFIQFPCNGQETSMAIEQFHSHTNDII